MTQADYEAELLRILRAHDAAARATLTALIAALPPKAREIHIVVFPDQDGEGTFSVVASLEGPDLFVLNKPSKATATCSTCAIPKTASSPRCPCSARTEPASTCRT